MPKIPLLLIFIFIQISFGDTETKEKNFSVEKLKSVLISDLGRQKPLDSYAKNTLLQFSARKKTTNPKQEAIEWLAHIFFTPAETYSQEIFRINNYNILESVNLTLPDKRRYSYNELRPGLRDLAKIAEQIEAIAPKERNAEEAELYRLFTNLTTYINLSASFLFAIPNSNFILHEQKSSEILQLPLNQPLSYLQVIKKNKNIIDFFNTLPNKPKEQWLDYERELVVLSKNLFSTAQFYINIPIGILPVIDTNQTSWISAWDALNHKFLKKSFFPAIEMLGKITISYLNQDQTEFDDNIEQFNQWVQENSAIKIKSPSTEILYNKLNSFYRSKLLYALSLLFFFLWLTFQKKLLIKAASYSLIIGFILHSLGILMRMFISGRPPVTNLYDTFIFVGWIIVLLGLIVDFIQKNKLGTLMAAISGFVMLMIAGKYSSEGETIQVLVAVLDSNFWLSTHVITITIGYAGTCAAGVVGHLYVILSLKKKQSKSLKELAKLTYGMAGFGLVFSFIGTVLGGIWADQSWGRFWGWDPKENGALLIVLWLSILFHLRLAGKIRDFGFSIGTIIGIMVVMFAWFGVNLLGVGLHSYGFTEGALGRLLGYYVIETFFVFSALWYMYLNNRKTKKQINS